MTEITVLHGAATRAYNRLEVHTRRTLMQNIDFVKRFEAEWRELTTSERLDLSKLFGWSFQRCKHVAHAGRHIDTRLQVIRTTGQPLTPGLESVIELCAMPQARVKQLEDRGMFASPASSLRLRQAARTGAVPPRGKLRTIKPRDPADKIQHCLASAANHLATTCAELGRASDLMAKHSIQSVKGPEIKDIRKFSGLLYELLSDVDHQYEYKLLEN